MPNITNGYNTTGVINKNGKETSPEVVITSILLCCSWIISINCLVFVCLVLNRRAMKTFVNLQLLSFSITDIFVGITAIPESLTYYITPNTEVCFVIMYGYMVAQAATLFHAFGICLHRYITVKYRKLHAKKKDKGQLKRIILHVGVIWCLVIVLVAIPFASYARFDHSIAECSLNAVFGDNYIKFLAVINAVFLLPQAGMNVLYICLFRYLSEKWNFKARNKRTKQTVVLLSFSRFNTTVQASSSPTVNIDATRQFDEPATLNNIVNERRVENATVNSSNEKYIGLDLEDDPVKSCAEISKSDLPHTKISNSYSDIHEEEYDSNEQNQMHNKLNPTAFVEPSYVNNHGSSNALGVPMKTAQYSETEKEIRNMTESENQNASSFSSWTNISRQTAAPEGCKPLTCSSKKEREVLCTIGIILLLLNMFITPLNLLLLIELIHDGLLSRKVKFILMFLALINSGLNPLVYALKMKPFREVLKRHKDRCAAFCRK